MASFLARLREAVSASAEPALQRAPDDDDNEKAPAKKPKAKRNPPAETEQTPAREAISLRTLLREAAIVKTGSAYEATVIREGAGNPEDANYYTREALRRAVAEGKFEGLQAYANHPTASEERERPERDVRQLVGHFREARYIDGATAEVRAKFVPIQGPGYEWVTSLIESALQSVQGRPLIGISIDGYGHAPDQQEIGGRTYNMVREVTHLGSADIVTRAGAGGQFHRRLQEAWRNTGSAERRPDTSKEVAMKPAQMQEKVKAAAAKLAEAVGCKDGEDEKASGLVEEALTAIRECAGAELEADVRIQEKIVEKPVAASGEEADKLAAKLRETETALSAAREETKAQKRARKDAEQKLAERDSAATAAKVLREAKVPEKSARAWFDDVADCENEEQMKRLVERKMAEREEILAEIRESYVEGAGPRTPSLPAPAGADLIDRLGLDRDEYVPAAN